MITQERLKEIVTYDPDTGKFKGIKRKLGDRTNGCGYLSIYIDKKSYKLHRLAWLYVFGKMPDKFIDHINGVRNDNRIINLRDVSNAINGLNKKNLRIDNTTGFMGVSKHSGGKFQARIKINGKSIHIGTFTNAQQAGEAYLKKKKEIQGFL